MQWYVPLSTGAFLHGAIPPYSKNAYYVWLTGNKGIRDLVGYTRVWLQMNGFMRLCLSEYFSWVFAFSFLRNRGSMKAGVRRNKAE